MKQYIFGFTLAAFSWASGAWFGRTYESKMVVTVHLAPGDSPLLAIQTPSDNGTFEYGMLLPKGYGCIDWLEPGEVKWPARIMEQMGEYPPGESERKGDKE